MRQSILMLPLALMAAGCGKSVPPPVAHPPVTVFAAASLKEAVGDITREWTRKSGQPVRLQFEASSTLARQIQEGAPADLFVTAAPEWLDPVKPIERFDWLSNRLVLVAQKDVRDVDLKTVESLALANEQVPVGKYAKAAMAYEGVKPPARTIYGANVRDVLSKVSQGGAQVGIVYATDAAIDKEVRIVRTFPPESHPKILYSVGLLTPTGKELFGALRESWAKAIAIRYGFTEIP
jgi:molybdate transport system substrate-binding protein